MSSSDEHGSSSSDDHIKVGVRVRPLSGKELQEDDNECLSAVAGTRIECGDDHQFTYDYAFDQSVTNEQLYNAAGKPLVDDVFRGYNATILAYGQTGSGKTFTMGTDACAGVQPGEALGVLPRFVGDMFERIAASAAHRSVTITCSLMEIYNDQMRDLLPDKSAAAAAAAAVAAGDGSWPPELKLDTSTRGVVNVIGLNRRVVRSLGDVLMALSEGLSERVVGATNMNAVSSRSHAIFEMQLASHPVERTPAAATAAGAAGATAAGAEPTTTTALVTAEDAAAADADADAATTAAVAAADAEPPEPSFSCRITFVDLAGSERLKRTGAEGARKDEGIAINKSLLVLGNVINSLCKGLAYVPYRECKLTRLLQNALGGNSRTLFLACVSPASNNLAESLNSLRYANRAREIKNSAVVNMDEHSRIAIYYRQREEALKDQLIRERFFGGRDVMPHDPEFIQRKALPSTTDYLDKVLCDANAPTGGWAGGGGGGGGGMRVAGSMSGTMISAGPRGSGYGATTTTTTDSSSASAADANGRNTTTNGAAGASSSGRFSGGGGGGGGGAKAAAASRPPVPRFSEAHKGKIDVDADLPVLSSSSTTTTTSTSSSSSSSSSSHQEDSEAETHLANLFASQEELEAAVSEHEADMDKRSKEADDVNDELSLKSEILLKYAEKIKSYAERYNRLRDEFDMLNRTAAEQDEEKHRLEQQIAQVCVYGGMT
jgi:hypothetical protein